MKRNRHWLILVVFFAFVNGLFIFYESWFTKKGVDTDVVILGNLIVFVATLLSFIIYLSSLKNTTPNSRPRLTQELTRRQNLNSSTDPMNSDSCRRWKKKVRSTKTFRWRDWSIWDGHCSESSTDGSPFMYSHSSPHSTFRWVSC